MDFENFKVGNWNYYLEFEKRMEETRRYVEFDKNNSKTFSSYYLMLFQAICSEIDVVGKIIAQNFGLLLDDNIISINKWWFYVQDNLPDVYREISFCDSILINPWKNYGVKEVTSLQNRNGRNVVVTRYNLKDKTHGVEYATPKWWTSYNKVKHKRLEADTQGINYEKANLANVINALGALYLLEFEFMKHIGTLKQRVQCGESVLFGMGDLQSTFIKSMFLDGETLTFQP